MVESLGSMFRRCVRTVGRGGRYCRPACAVILSLAALTACATVQGDGGGDTGTGGSAGSGGLAQGGAQPSGGSAGFGGTTGGAAMSGASGTAPGTGGEPVAGAGGSGAVGGAMTGGSAGSDVGGAGAAGGGTAGGATGGSGPGAGSGGMAGDRCDVAVYNAADPPAIVPVSGSLGTHDPVVIEAAGRFYLFHTGGGMGLGAKTSTDFAMWANATGPLSPNPSWISGQVPGVSNLWAPDISYFGGQYHLYYSASTFGDNQSCIGHATRPALDTGSWMDHGQVICSNVGTNDNWNAIDPNVIIDETGAAHLSFGSFWSGIKMIHLDTTGARMGTELLSLANRPQNSGALEAPFIVRRCGYYYLFVSWDTCCQGVNSTYNIRVGRSTSVTGPYADKAGTAMPQGGGTLLVQADTRWRGPGHNAIIFRGDAAYNVYHSYDANNNGRVTLRISEIAWDAEGWPISAGP
jgi:arabinan endo-1,5-alpha-L-arabinosidase